MKAVQIGILAALLVCAGLLYTVYRGQQGAPEPTPVEAAAPQTPVPLPAPAQPAAEPATPAATPAIERAVQPAPRKPSPTRVARKEPKPVETARPAVEDPAAPAQPVAQVQTPPPPVQAPTPVEQKEPAVPLNPPSGAREEQPVTRAANTVTIPAGTLIAVRLGETLSSERNQPGDTFTATLDQPLVVDGFALAERGSRVEGKVLESTAAGRVKGLAHLAVALTRLHTTDGQQVEIRTESFQKEGPKSTGDDAKKVGVGAAVGAAIGAIAGGGKGAAIGAGVGGAAGAGTVMATRGKPAELPVETRLRFKLEAPVTITEKVK